MLNFSLLLILCAVATVHCGRSVGAEECERFEGGAYTLRSYAGGYLVCYLKPNQISYYLWDFKCHAEDHITPRSEGECIQRLINKCAYDDINQTPFLPVVNANTKTVGRTQLTPYEILKSETLYVRNNAEIKQEAQTTQYAEQKTSSFEFSMTQKIGIKASQHFGIPLLGGEVEISADFTFGEKWTRSVSKTITFPSQKVVVPPKSRIRLNFEVRRARFETTSTGTFTLDPNQELIKKCLDKVHAGTHFLSLQGSGKITQATFDKDKQTVNDFPMTYVGDEYETEVSISEAEPISAFIADTPPIHEIDILDLHSFKLFSTS